MTTQLEHAKSELDKARELYDNCDCEQRWREYRLLMQHWQQTVDRLSAVRLPCGCVGTCDPFSHDTAPNWDGKQDGPGPDDCGGLL